MSESEFLRGRISAKHLAGAAPTDMNAASKPPKPLTCNTEQTTGCPKPKGPGKGSNKLGRWRRIFQPEGSVRWSRDSASIVLAS